MYYSLYSLVFPYLKNLKGEKVNYSLCDLENSWEKENLKTLPTFQFLYSFGNSYIQYCSKCSEYSYIVKSLTEIVKLK